MIKGGLRRVQTKEPVYGCRCRREAAMFQRKRVWGLMNCFSQNWLQDRGSVSCSNRTWLIIVSPYILTLWQLAGAWHPVYTESVGFGSGHPRFGSTIITVKRVNVSGVSNTEACLTLSSCVLHVKLQLLGEMSRSRFPQRSPLALTELLTVSHGG